MNKIATYVAVWVVLMAGTIVMFRTMHATYVPPVKKSIVRHSEEYYAKKKAKAEENRKSLNAAEPYFYALGTAIMLIPIAVELRERKKRESIH